MPDLSQAFSETKSLPDDILKREMATPTGALPSWMVASELSERQALRSGGFKRKPSIAQQIMQRANTLLPAPDQAKWGIPADVQRDGAPTPQPNQNSAFQPPMPSQPQGGMPRYAEGGLVKQEPQAPAIVPNATAAEFTSAYTDMRHASDRAPTGLQQLQAMGMVPQGQNIRSADLGALKVGMDTGQTLQSVKDRASFFGGLEDVIDKDTDWKNNILPTLQQPAALSAPSRYSEGGIVRNLNPFIALTDSMQDSEIAGTQNAETAMDRNGGYMPISAPRQPQALGMTRNLSSLQPLPPGTLQPVQGLGAFQRR